MNNVRPLRFSALSLVTKLMWLYSFSTLGLLGAICLFLSPTVVKIMEQTQGKLSSSLTGECFEKVIISLLIASLATLVFGHIISRKGLKRLREFETRMANITAHSLDDRILLSEWPKELRSLASRFNEMLDRIQRSFIQLSQFSSDIAHELRTPVHNLRNMVEVSLLKADQSPQEYRKLLESSMNEYQHLSKLVENMLFIARSEHGQTALKKKCLDIKEEMDDICDYYQYLADEKQILLSCHGEAKAEADPLLFKRLVVNLLSNAIKYTPRKGKISIHIQAMQAFVQISIVDSGIGISPEHLPHIFKRFYRVDSSRTQDSGGLGLGLAIVKSIVDLHQGSLKAESQINRGTRVQIQLPITKL